MDAMTNHFMESKSTDDMENYVSLQEMIFGLREMVQHHFMVNKMEPLNELTPINHHTSF